MIYGWTGTPGAGKTREMLHQLFLELTRLVASHRGKKNNLFLYGWLWVLRRLVRNSKLCTQLAIRFPVLRGLYKKTFRRVWRVFFRELIKKHPLVPVIFINFYTPEGKPAINLEFWQKHFPEIHFIYYPFYPAKDSSQLLQNLIGEWNVPEKTPVFPSIWVFDELQQFFPKTATNAKPTIYEQFFEKHRHFGVNVYFTTQGMKLLASHFRDLIEKHFHITNPFRNGFVQIMEFTGCNMRLSVKEAARVTRGFQATYIFQAYTSSMLHLEKKGVPTYIKLAVVGVVVLAIVAFSRWYFAKQAIKNEVDKTSKKIEGTPQVFPQPNQMQQTTVPSPPIEAKKEEKKIELRVPGGKTMGWRSSQENPFSEYGVSDPSHVSFHGVVGLGKKGYRMCFYVKNFFCAWVELPESVKVKKVFTTMLLVWEDWVIPMTAEGMHPQIATGPKWDSDSWGGQMMTTINPNLGPSSAQPAQPVQNQGTKK